jgi:nucleotide-binding universal stress UspA family protein
MNKIITCIDGSALSQDICLAAVWAAQKLDKPLMLLHAIEKQRPDFDDLSGFISLGARTALLEELSTLDQQRSRVARQLGEEFLRQAATLARQNGCDEPEQVQRHGGIVDALADFEDQARLIVLGRSGQNDGGPFKALGSHIEQIIRQVQTPVLIASPGFRPPKSFMLAYDGRDIADKAVQRILDGGLLQGMECHLVTVKNNKPGTADKFHQARTLLEENGFNVQAQLLEGPIFSALQQYRKDHPVDLQVMGAFSRSKLATVFLGSNTLKTLEQHTASPVLILR